MKNMGRWFVVTQNPANRQLVVIETDDDPPQVAVFPTPAAAEQMAAHQPACKAWGYEIYEWRGTHAVG